MDKENLKISMNFICTEKEIVNMHVHYHGFIFLSYLENVKVNSMIGTANVHPHQFN